MPATETGADRLVDLYLRLSNAVDGADSLVRQERDLREWADREGLFVRKVWSDYGRSGFDRNVRRDGFDSAVRAVVSKEAGTLAVWKLDRLSRRGAAHIAPIAEEVAAAGGRIVFLMDGLDSQQTTTRMVINLLSDFARSESENTSTRVRSRKAADRAAGRFLGGAAPIGYRLDDDRRLRPHATEFALMRELVQRVTDGESLLAVARDWNAREIPTRRGGLWRPSTLSNALRSPTLAGLMTQMDENGAIRAYRDPETGEHVCLIAEGFEAVATGAEQARLLAVMDGRLRQWGRGRRVVRQPKSLLGLVVKCASCRRSLTTFGESYRCKRSFTDGTDCTGPVTVRVATLDDAVRRAWSRRLAALEPGSAVLDRVGERWLRRFNPVLLKERADLLSEIEESNARLVKADADHYQRGTLDGERHDRVTAALLSRLTDLRARLAALPTPKADLRALLDPDLSLPAIEEAPVAEARDLLRLAIEAVYVSPAPRAGARFVPADRLTFDWVE
ncbi:recombinase family protein [Isoptericola halotolerans]|uniref:recombinase family protein n=1 Tax=Isoptericola halotolerans TaxID=300560 RepID=UPI00388D03D4